MHLRNVVTFLSASQQGVFATVSSLSKEAHGTEAVLGKGQDFAVNRMMIRRVLLKHLS